MVKGRNDGKPLKPPEFLVKLRRMLLDEPSEVIEYKSGMCSRMYYMYYMNAFEVIMLGGCCSPIL